jgi:catechol 2,3-dioxygenase-like lactoylglutathione lyase family enzyme
MNETTGPLGIRGVNHLALVCADMARTVDFYQGVLGLPLIKTIELPGGAGQHFFFDLGNGDSLAFFWFPDAPAPAPGVAAPRALPGLGDLRSAVASMNHLAFDVAPERLDEAARRLRRAGVEVLGPVNHDDSEAGWSLELHPGVFMRSVYFFDPDGICLELAAWLRRPGPQDVRHEPHRGSAVPAT